MGRLGLPERPALDLGDVGLLEQGREEAAEEKDEEAVLEAVTRLLARQGLELVDHGVDPREVGCLGRAEETPARPDGEALQPGAITGVLPKLPPPQR